MQKIAVIVLGLFLALANCEKKQTASAPAPEAQSWPGKMTLSWQPSPPVSNKDVIFVLRLANTSGQPISGASVQANLMMQTMDMGKNDISFTDQGGGEYRGSGKFTMAGPWSVVVTGSSGGVTGRQTFPVVVNRE